MTGVRPTCLALLFCERVGRVRHSGRASPVGVFHAMTARRFPASTRPFSAWMQLNQGNGQVRMRLVIERFLPDAPECETLLAVQFALYFADPNDVGEHVIDFEDGIEIPCERSYQARLAAGEVTIMTRPFVAASGQGE